MYAWIRQYFLLIQGCSNMCYYEREPWLFTIISCSYYSNELTGKPVTADKYKI